MTDNPSTDVPATTGKPAARAPAPRRRAPKAPAPVSPATAAAPVPDPAQPSLRTALLRSRRAVATDLATELLGSLTVVFIGAAAVIGTGGSNQLLIGLAYGLAIAVMIAATGYTSGGAFNPAVVAVLAIARRMEPLRAVGLIAAQLTGAVIAALLLKLVFPAALSDPVRLGTPGVGSGFAAGNAFAAEVIASFFLAYVVFTATGDRRGSVTVSAVAIGLCVSMDVFAIGSVSGGAMNPARWFGPALVQGQFDNAWVWIGAPPAGVAIAAIVYFLGLLRNRRPDPD